MSEGQRVCGGGDVWVEFNGERIRLFDADCGLMLTCTRAAGWELWNKERVCLLAGENHSTPLRVVIDGVVVCGAVDGEQEDQCEPEELTTEAQG